MIEFLNHVLGGQNQFASGGLLLMAIGAVGAYLRSIPEKVWYWVVGQTTMMITVKDDDAVFVWVKEWFLDQKFLKRVRRIDLDTTLQSERVALIPAPGVIGSGTQAGRFRYGSRVPKTRASVRRSEWSR